MSFQFTYEILRKIAPGGNQSIQQSLIDPLNKYMAAYGVTTLLRVEHFIAQAAEESASFRTLTEYASGKEYEGRRDLGNVNPGDGVRYKGRGIFQLTGRANYNRYGLLLKLNLVDNPYLAATADVAVQTAFEYWKDHNLNLHADQNDIETITRRINGGLNGLAQRQAFLTQAHAVLAPLFAAQPIVAPKPVPVAPVTIPVTPVSVPVAPKEVPVAPVEVPAPATDVVVTSTANWFQWFVSSIKKAF